ncbi:hypothetical protein DSECCO2_73900 [anaerobic digester metagenome]
MPATYETQLNSILNRPLTIDNFYDELNSLYTVLYPESTEFVEFISLPHYKRSIKKLTEQIGIDLFDFQEKERANYQFPFIYALVTGTYFIKMVHDKQISGSTRNTSESFFELVTNGKLDQIKDSDLYNFHEILTKVLSVALYSKSFGIEYSDMIFSPNEEFFGLIDSQNIKHLEQLYNIKDNIDFISSNYTSTLKFKYDISLIKANFIEDVSEKFNSIVDRLTKKNVLDALSMFSSENETYQDLVVNKLKRQEIEKKAAEKIKRIEMFSSMMPTLDFETDLSEDVEHSVFENDDLVEIGAQLQLPDKAILSVLLKIKIHSYVLSKSELPSQLIFKYYQTILEDIANITDDFALFCEKYLEIIDSYISDLELPPNAFEIIKMVYADLLQENQTNGHNSNMLAPLTEKEFKNLLAHFGMNQQS